MLGIDDIIIKKSTGKKISAITSYDYTMASICDKAGIDIILVGDSAGIVMLGYENTLSVKMDHMCVFTEAVSKASNNALVVADLPFMSYNSTSEAIINASKLTRSGACAVKLEGGNDVVDKVKAISNIGIPVMGHIGLQPQTMIHEKHKIKGQSKDEAIKLIDDAKLLEKSGVFCIVLEMISYEVAKIITDTINIPTIGIGSGKYCDGQILVIHDVLGLYDKINLKFTKRYLTLSIDISNAIKSYKNEVENGKFPNEKNCFFMDKIEHKKLINLDQ